jgi:hypothetical protein
MGLYAKGALPSNALIKTIFDTVDQIFILCVAHCDDFGPQKMGAWWNKTTLFDGKANDLRVWGEKPMAGHGEMATRAHYDIAQNASARNFQTILVLEDDVMFRNDISKDGWGPKDLLELESFIRSEKLGILRIGYYAYLYSWEQYEDGYLYRQSYSKCRSGCECEFTTKHRCQTPKAGCYITGSEAYILSSKMFDKMPKTKPTIDIWMGENETSQLLFPMIATQENFMDPASLASKIYRKTCGLNDARDFNPFEGYPDPQEPLISKLVATDFRL